MSNSPSFSVLGSDVAIKGDITAKSDLHIDGRVEGDVEYESLTIEPGAKVDGRLSQRDNQPAEASLEAEASGEPHLTLAAIN